MKLDDERLQELITWSGGYGMPDVCSLLKELKETRAAILRLKEWVSLVQTSTLPLDGNCIRQLLEEK